MRRTYLKGALALFGALVLGFTSNAVFAQTQTIKISHQFPGGTIDEGDFRDRLVRKFAAEVEKRTNGSLKFEIYPAASLMKAVPQYKALSTGALDMSLYPLAYAGGEFPEANLTLMPGGDHPKPSNCHHHSDCLGCHCRVGTAWLSGQ